jgi:hypothetical protein
MLLSLGFGHASATRDAASRRPQGAGIALKYYALRGKTFVESLVGHRPAGPSGGRLAFRRSKPAVSAIADERKIIWVRPEDIVFKIKGDHSLHANDIRPGDWDLRRSHVSKTSKFVSIIQHFRDGRPWDDTALFADYCDRINRGQLVRGTNNRQGLKRQYETRVDTAFEDMRANGFRIARDILGRPTNLPHVHIGRNGEVIYGTRGNHRLAMAKLLSLRVIPCHVRARHADWQRVRESVLKAVLLTKDAVPATDATLSFRGHPDLADLYYPNQ